MRDLISSFFVSVIVMLVSVLGVWEADACTREQVTVAGHQGRPNRALQQTAGHDRFLGVQGSACPAG